MANETEKICYDLPTTVDTTVFGPAYWNAFHDLASKIPCTGCKEEAESFVRFWHDYKNVELNKPIFDKQNYQYWLTKITSRNKVNTAIIVSLIILAVTMTLIAIFKK